VLLNLFQVRLRARDVPDGHVAEGTVRAEPNEVHPGDETEVIVDLQFTEGGPPGSIDVKVSPPEDFETGDPVVEIREDGATVTIPASTNEEVELGSYYLQVVYSDGEKEHFEAEAALEMKRHWVRIGEASVEPARASPGDPVDVTVDMGFEGAARVRGHVRGRLVPDHWDGEEEHAVKLPRERCSITGSRDQVWRVRIPRNVPEAVYHADIEFSSGDGTARRRTRQVLRLVPEFGVEATLPLVEPGLMAPGDAVTVTTSVENIGREPLDVRTGGDLLPEVGGASVPLEERLTPLGPGEVGQVEWRLQAPERPGRWMVRVRARTDRTEGSDPQPALMDVRPPNMVHVVGAVPTRPWASPGETVTVNLQVQDAGSRPGCEASLEVVLEGESGETSASSWRGSIGPEEIRATVDVQVPTPPGGEGQGEEGTGGSDRFALVVRESDGNELLRVPSAVAVRKLVRLLPRVVKAEPDPTRVGDALLPGERVTKTLDSGELTVMELSSGCRMYARGDLVAGVDQDMPMDEDFWDQALDADMSLYTDLKKGLEKGAKAARAEALTMRSLAEAMGPGEGQASGPVRDSRELAKTFDPDRRSRGVSPRSGPLAPLAAWLADPAASPDRERRTVLDLRNQLDTTIGTVDPENASTLASAAARAAADHLDRLAELLSRAWERDMMDAGTLRGATALVAAAGVAQVELQRLREVADPWITPSQALAEAKVVLQSMSAQLAALLEMEVRHRIRRAACQENTRLRAARAAVARELEVEAVDTTGHSGDAAQLDVVLENRSATDLDLMLNVALPSEAWTVLEPVGRGARLVSVGPVTVPARTSETLAIVIYIPTTVKLDSYVLPLEVVAQPRDLVPEQESGRG
jgi:hypothetical protein